MKKVTTVGAAALATCGVLAGGAMLTAPVAQAQVQARPDLPDRPVVAAGLPQIGDQLAYVQRGQVVTVYRAGQPLAEVSAQSAAHPGGRGRLVLRVKAHQTFTFRVGQFLWNDAKGDHDAFNPLRKVRVPAKSTETVTIRFDHVGDGNVIWAPRREQSIGVWQVRGSKPVGAPQLLEPSYVQRDASVSVYKAGKVVARVKAQTAVHAKGRGVVRLDIEAFAKFAVRPAALVWVDKDGDRHRPVGGKKVVFQPKTTRSMTVSYQGVEAGGLVWSPRAELVAGHWGIG